MNADVRIAEYQHTQPGWLLRWLLFAIAVFEVGTLAVIWLIIGTVSTSLTLPLLLLVLVAAYMLTGSRTVTVDRQRLYISLGVGLLRRSIALADIAECHSVRNSWWYGWGIRFTPRGWLWCVSGFDAVELTYRSRKHFRIGTDEPRTPLRSHHRRSSCGITQRPRRSRRAPSLH